MGSGKFRTEAENKRRAEQGDHGRKFITSTDYVQTEDEIRISAALEKVANEIGAKSITAGTLITQDGCGSDLISGLHIVAIAYVLQKTPYVFPIIGGRRVEHLAANLEALDIDLSDEQMQYLESTVPLEPGFPYNMIVSLFDCKILEEAHVLHLG